MANPKRETLAQEWQRQSIFVKMAVVTGLFFAVVGGLSSVPAKADEKKT